VVSILTGNKLRVAWGLSLSPILESLTRQATNPCREVRTAALSLLQRILLGDLLPPPSPQTTYWPEVIFDKSLLHLINELLRPEVFASDKRGMGETRVSGGHMTTSVWGQILDVLIRLVGSGQRDVLV
jgi:golgi-specific brefeldin A-resistance guanine nucleotide exchange factor 1